MVSRPGGLVGSLYVHVPFCARKCAYCAFFSQATSSELVARYVPALIRELELVSHDLRPATIFFGGGTPTLLNLTQWAQILDAIDRLDVGGAEEWTVECNPATLSLDKARLLRDHGVNRVSLGVQSLDEALLDRLGRVHSRDMVFRSFDLLRRAGFQNINLDLMFAIPGQTLAVWRNTLREALGLGSEHLSSYEVIYEEDTPLYEQLKAGQFDLDEDLACAMYEELVDHAHGAGFIQYEIANFARHREGVSTSAGPWGGGQLPSRACRHNVNYWRGGSFYGLGPSATSYVRGERTKNWSNTEIYCQELTAGRRAIESRERLEPLARAGETAAFGLRMVSGWGFEEFRKATGYDLQQEWSAEMRELSLNGLGLEAPGRFQLTRRGLRFADTAAELFLR